jgi:hypothetical protein
MELKFTTMKKILLVAVTAMLMACSADDASVTNEEVTLFVNHYKTTSTLHGTQFLIQENEAIGSTTFEGTAFITNFDFEPGFTYDMTAKKITTENTVTNATTVSYELVTLQDKKQVSPQATFEIPVTTFLNGVGYISFIQGSTATGFKLGQEITIDCLNECSQLEGLVTNEEIATGTFSHGPNSSYVLQGLY